MNIDAQTFRRIAKPIIPPNATLSPYEAQAIVQLGYLAFGADLDEDRDERALLDQLGNYVCGLGGIELANVPRPSPLPLPRDDEARIGWLEDLGAQLTSTTARELGYVVASLVTMGDLQSSPVESVFLDELRQVLGIEEERAGELVLHATQQVTPMGTRNGATVGRDD
jgi:hypothetical protein